ncbi:Ig-like domain-containing protein [Rhodococcus sp. IEGM 1379]|uniref:Ig-like domain-containing protein n=1 Tax=Rhodococcus sp. IEGM 1379 TaxID=3047086 RepID=UPI0024B77C21|nr:Ig-like domain-containing protein [Rhodococcus sp. IEGM 1379]MDI9915225.1 Ig-like domain-containing protein [Rhodococcus sp. IEGM 1379]
MSERNIRRVVGGVSACAIAAGLAVSFGTGVASAAPDSVAWKDGGSNFERTVSNVTPSEGDTITISTKFMRTGAVEYIYRVTDQHPTCLTYVEDSAKVDGSPRAIDSTGVDYAQVKGTVIEWPVYPNINPKSRTFSFDYKVGAGCDRGVALQTGMSYNGSLGEGKYPGKGPAFTVQVNNSTTALDTVPSGVQVGQTVPLKATVIGGALGNTVEFYDGGTKIGEGALDATGAATFNWKPTSKGTHNLSAKFVATSKANESTSAAQSVGVSQADALSTTTLATVSGAQVGTSTTLKATVSPAGAGGTVTFTIDGKPTVVAVGANGEATYAWTPETSGSQTITAAFSGRSGVSTSTTSTTVTVAEAPASNTASTTDLTVGSAQVGKSTAVSAQIDPANAGGTVTFKDGDTVIGTVAVDGSGVARIDWTPSAAGQRTITAEFSGAGTVNGSADSATLQVAEAGTPGDGGNGGGSGSLGSLGGFGSSS